MPVTTQCHILQLSGPSLNYTPVAVSDKDREIMRFIDEIHLKEPSLGSRGMKNALKIQGHKVGRIRARILMRKMEIGAIYTTSLSNISGKPSNIKRCI